MIRLTAVFIRISSVVFITKNVDFWLGLAVMTVTVPTPIHPIPTCLCPSWVIRIIPEHPISLLNPLAPSRANLHLSNALLNTPTPLHLVNTFPTRRSFNLSSSLHQVNSQHPHSFPTWRHSTFSLLCQVYSRRLINLATVVGQSPITYLPRSMHPSPSFLALYIYVSLLSIVHSSVTSLTTVTTMTSHPSLVTPTCVYSQSRPHPNSPWPNPNPSQAFLIHLQHSRTHLQHSRRDAAPTFA